MLEPPSPRLVPSTAAARRPPDAKQSKSAALRPVPVGRGGGPAEPWPTPTAGILALGVTACLRHHHVVGRRGGASSRRGALAAAHVVAKNVKAEKFGGADAGAAFGERHGGSPRRMAEKQELPRAGARPPSGLRMHVPSIIAAAELAEEEDTPTHAKEVQQALDELGMDLQQFKDIVRYSFDRFDVNGDGQLSVEELRIACQTLGLRISHEGTASLLRLVAGNPDYWRPSELQQAPAERLQQAVQVAMQKRYDDMGLNSVGPILDNIMEALATGSLDTRLKAVGAVLQDYGEPLFDQGETFIDLLGIGLAGYSILDAILAGDHLDAISTVPLVLLLWKTSSDATKAFGDTAESDLCQDQATLLATVFKPAGFTAPAFKQLCREADAQWRFIPKGTVIPQESLQAQLQVISKGQLKAIQKSPVPGLHETLATLGPGMFLGHGALLGDDELSFDFHNDGRSLLVQEEALVLGLDMDKLKRYIKVEENACEGLYLALARSQFEILSQIKRQSQRIANELPLLFRDLALSAAAEFGADRATLWIHSAEESALWTLFVAEDGSSSYVSIDDCSGLAGHCFVHGEIVNIPDPYQDDRFNPEVDRKTGYRTRSVLCVPITGEGSPGGGNSQGKIIGVLQLINKLSDEPQASVFTSHDEKKAYDNMRLLRLMMRQVGNRYNNF